MADLLIRGGQVIDGSGRAPFRADVLVEADRIAEIGSVSSDASRVIDAAGAVVAPGFIDLHTHCDFTIHDHPEAPSAVHQGVTTVVTGNCGYSGFPLAAGTQRRVAEWCGFIGGREELLAEDARARFAALGSLALGPNVIQLVGHGAMRLAVMGDARRAPTTGELDAMDAALREALAAGAAGLSSGLIYPPGSYADAPELERLVRTVAARGATYATHVRDEGAGVVEAVREAIDLARHTGARVHISHLKSTSGLAGVAEDLVRTISTAVHQGLDVSADQYPYTMSSTKLGAVLSMRDTEPEQVLIATDPTGRFAGRTLAQLGRDLGQEPMDVLRGLPRTVLDTAQVLLLDRMQEADVRHILASPLVAIASDGWTLDGAPDGNPHPRNFGTFARVLGHYARDQGLVSLAAAIQKMTSLPARVLGLGDRGLVAPGMVADLTVFDPGAVSDRATAHDPFALASGMRHVLVAGEPLLENGTLTDRRPGRVLRRLDEGWSA